MRKFTEQSGNRSRINETKKVVNNTENVIKNIVESSLNISVDGEIDDYLFRNIDIDGKDKLIEKLKSYIDEVSYNTTSMVLERIKYQGVDKVIQEHISSGDIQEHITKVESLLKTSDPIGKAMIDASSMKDGKRAYYRGVTAEKLITDHPPSKRNTLREIRGIFTDRAKQLGFNI